MQRPEMERRAKGATSIYRVLIGGAIGAQLANRNEVDAFRPRNLELQMAGLVLHPPCSSLATRLVPASAMSAQPDLSPLQLTDAELRRQFDANLRRWKDETAAISSTTQRSLHPAYQRIIGMGPRAVPLMLEELKVSPTWLFWALKAITNVDPVPPQSQGKLKEMAQAWIAWGRDLGLVQ
jgi:hypothetical protein